jgi:hypothetical protein
LFLPSIRKDHWHHCETLYGALVLVPPHLV